MKKSLSAILATSMVASMFASVAFAAEAPKTAQEMFDVLKTKGIFEGINDAGDAGLQNKMNRAQVSKILVKLMGLTEDEAGAAGYKDLTVETWAKGYIGAATKAGLMEGTAVGAFDPAGTFTTEQLAAVMVRALKLPEGTDAVEGKVSDWAKGYVAAAVKAGLIAKTADYSAPALREVLVMTSFQAYTKIEEAKKPVVAVDSKVIGAKKIEVTFAKAVETTKATFEVKKGTFPANVAKVSWNEAKTVATVEMAAKFAKGDYTLSVGGVTDPAVTKTFTLEDEKVAEIKFNAEKAPLNRGSLNAVTVGYKVFNQYNEDVTSANTVNVSVDSRFTVNGGTNSGTDSDGSIAIALVSGNFTLNDTVAVNLLHSSGVFKSQVLTVAQEAKVATVDFTELYTTETTKTIDTATDLSSKEYVVLVDAKDQYGNSITTAADAATDVYLSVINDTVVTKAAATSGFKTVSKDGKNVLAVKLAAPSAGLKAGKATLMAVSNTTGNKDTFEVEIKDVVKVDTMSLSAPDLVVAGEKVELTFNAVDQFGAAINDAAKLNDAARWMSKLTISNVTYNSFAFEQDYVNNKAKLVLDLAGAADAETTAFISGITSTGKLVQLSVPVKKIAKPVVVTAVKDVKPAIVEGATTSFGFEKISVVDQYGRTKDLKSYKTGSNLTYTATITSSETGKVTATTTGTAATDFTTALAGVAGQSGTSNITVKIDGINNSEFTFPVKVVKKSELTDFEVADVAKLHTGGSAYAKSVSVTGLLADGTKVALNPADRTVYSVTYDTYLQFDSANSKLYADAATQTAMGGASKDKTYSIIISGFAKDGVIKNFVKEVAVSSYAPVAEKVELRTSGVATKEGDTVISVSAGTDLSSLATIVANAVKVTDQYGVEMTASDKVTYHSADYAASLVAGKSFNVVAVANGKSLIFKVIVK